MDWPLKDSGQPAKMQKAGVIGATTHEHSLVVVVSWCLFIILFFHHHSFSCTVFHLHSPQPRITTTNIPDFIYVFFCNVHY